MRAGRGRQGDLHEFILTPANTALLTFYEPVAADLRAVSGPAHGMLLDSGFQEVDVASGEVLFEWQARHHVALEESYLAANGQPESSLYDYFHINSVCLDHDGDYLISGRYPWCVYKVSRARGQIVWRLNGKRSDFIMGPGTQFVLQHDVRRLGNGNLSVFDDGAGPPNVHLESRGIELALDMASMRASLVVEFLPDPSLLTTSQGSIQQLDNGNFFLGWGAEPVWSEYRSDGRLLYSAQLAAGLSSYRALRYRWAAVPTERPAVVARRAGDGVDVAVSWNGASTVSHWQVLGGPSPTRLQVVATLPKVGFETRATVRSAADYVSVVGRDRSGVALGYSSPTAVN